MKLLNIDMTFDQIKNQTKFTFRKYVKAKVKYYTFKCLMNEKSKQRKCCNIKFDCLETQEYLLNSCLTTQQKKMLFQMRTAVFPVFENISFLVENTLCPCCSMASDSMEHQLRCPVIQSNTQIISKTGISMDDIFSANVNVQSNVAILFEQAIKRRSIILNHTNTNNKKLYKQFLCIIQVIIC